jgi:dTDP-4-amino-4,6-dideoxygalactose transaminase
MRYPLTSNSVISPAAIEAAVVCLRSGWHTMGREVEAFEQEFAAWVGAKHAVMVNSGSSANLLAVEALKLPGGLGSAGAGAGVVDVGVSADATRPRAGVRG